MKHVQESLKDYYVYKSFRVFEDDEAEEKSSLKDKEADGLAAVEKAKKNFEEFKKAAKGDIQKWKEFWEENKLTKEAFDEEGSIYQLWDSDFVLGVLELPATTLSDGSLDGGFGADDTEPEVEEEIIEGPDLQEMKPTNQLTEAVAPAPEEDEDPMAGIDLGLEDPGEPGDMGQTELGNEPMPPAEAGGDLAVDAPQENPAEVPPVEGDPNADMDMGAPTDDMPMEEPQAQTPDLDAPQVYFVVYDNKGEGREEILRCGSNNVVKAFNAFYNDTFKGSMKDIIIQYKAQKEALKKEAEKSKKEKVEKEKDSKIKKFLGGGTSEPKEEKKEEKPEKKEEKTNESWRPKKSLVPTKGEKLNESYEAYNRLNEADEFQQQWLNEVYTLLIEQYEMNDDEAATYMEMYVNEDLLGLYAEGVDSTEAAEIVVTNESAIGKLYEEFGAIDREHEDFREFPNEQDDDYDEDRELSNFKHSLNVMLEDEANPLGVDEEIIYNLTALINGGDIDDTIERLFNLDTDPLEALEYLMNDKAVCDELGISCEEDSFDEGKFVTEGARFGFMSNDDSTKDGMIARWEEMAEEGYDLNSIANEMQEMLGNPDAYERILDIVEEDVDEKLGIEEIVTQLIEEFEGESEHREDVYHGRSQTYEGVNEDYDPDLDDEEDEEDYEDGEDYEQEMRTDNPASQELLDQLDELEQEIWNSDNQSMKDKWDELSQSHLEGASYWGDIDSWNVERAIEDATNLLKEK